MSRIVSTLASGWTTLAALAALAVTVVAGHLGGVVPPWVTVLPFTALGLNLATAMLVNPRLRSGALGLLHGALLALLLLAAAGRLMRFEGRVEITEGAAFEPAEVETLVAGRWHQWRLADAAFVQQRFSVAYHAGLRRGHTESQVLLPDGTSRVVGDDAPLVLAGYRFYTTHNKGFAPVVAFADAAGVVTTGAIHMPSYPLFDWRQYQRWTTPRGEALGLWLRPNVARTDDGPWRLAADRGEPVLVVHASGRRVELTPGQQAAVVDGELRFLGVRGWMGYRIFSDPTLPWMLLAAAAALVGFLWHLWPRATRQAGAAVASSLAQQQGFAR